MLSPLNEGGAPVILCAVRDITERGALEEQLMRRTKELETLHVQLTELASRDPLTSLHNRRSFGEQLEWLLRNACRRRESLSLLMIDLDRFKRVNDRFGHAEGDRTLRAVSEAIAGACRQNDVAARYGGEEFAVALPDTDAAGSLLVAENVRHAIEDIAGLRERITASIGAATWVCGEDAAVPPQTADELIAQADRALYRAKAEGRNCVRHGGAQAAAGHLSV
ncbi:MAG: GGDEF domain-containing protein [Betaproteobacteria bacterium]|nr:GGDEF domain-containing protein [Betaproteobacteria bacterium]